MSSPAERADKVRRDLKRAYARVTVTDRRADYADVLLPHGSLVFHTRTEVVEWLRAGGLVVLDQQQAEKLLGPDYHVVDVGPDGWAIKHPVACRDDLLNCEYHLRAMKWENGPNAPGRYRADIEGGTLKLALLSAGEGPK